MLWLEVTTDYRPRTDVERWQIQDRLRLRLRNLGIDSGPRFYEAPHGRLAFRFRAGWRPDVALTAALERIDDATAFP